MLDNENNFENEKLEADEQTQESVDADESESEILGGEEPITEESVEGCDAETSEGGEAVIAPKRSRAASVIDYVEIFVLAICFVIIIFSFFTRLCKVVGPSMENTLFEGETLIVTNLAYEPERGDIIVFHQTGEGDAALNEPIVKRVIAVGGETVNIDFETWTVTITDKDGNTFVYDEPYMYLDKSAPLLTSAHEYPYEVPEGSLFVMGDNRNHSADSRGTSIGLVDERRVLGKVVLRVSPFSKFGKVE
ncbi:MAG: signal peptidase I [Clostridia bacterium]|nr:signal peptidase I [Clostridia bacterium]